MPAVEDVTTMLPPPRWLITGTTYLIPSHTPRTLTAMTRSKTSMGYSGIGDMAPSIPALAKYTSMPPQRFTAALTYSWAWPG